MTLSMPNLRGQSPSTGWYIVWSLQWFICVPHYN